MKYLTASAEEKIKAMDFCVLKGSKEYGVSSIKELVDVYLENWHEPCTEIEVELFKYRPFAEYRKGIYLDDILEQMDDYYKEDYTSLGELPDEVFEAEKKLYQLLIKNYQRYYGESTGIIKIDISEEICLLKGDDYEIPHA